MVIELLRKVRDYCNHPWKKTILFQERIVWNKLISSLDTIDDSQQAINGYLELPEFKNSTESYLFLYGVMQALNIQQDAINNLYSSLFDQKIDWKNQYPELYEIREYRNDSIGHPTNRKNNYSFHMITRNSIKKDSFEMISFYPKTGEKTDYRKIKTIECIEIQRDLISDILNKTLQKLETEFKNHKEKFKGKKLIDVFPKTFDYHITKLYEGDSSIIQVNFKVISETYVEIKNQISNRYNSLDMMPSIQELFDRLDYLINKLENNIFALQGENKFELEIYINSLKLYFEELETMCVEIDQDFSE